MSEPKEVLRTLVEQAEFMRTMVDPSKGISTPYLNKYCAGQVGKLVQGLAADDRAALANLQWEDFQDMRPETGSIRQRVPFVGKPKC